MWQLIKRNLTARSTKYSILEGKKYLSIERWIELITTSEPFMDFYIESLQSIDHDSYYWEVRPVTTDTVSEWFEFVITESPSLYKIKSNPSAFQKFLHISKPAVSFPNLGGDAQLICPSAISGKDCYGHMAIFMREAPMEQLIVFWKKVAVEYQNKICSETKWLSAAGLGVPWLHVRIDSKPKYYKHQAYKAENYEEVTRIHDYIRKGDMTGIKKILSYAGADTVRANLENDGPASIHTAANYGQLEVVKFLLGQEINEDPNLKRMNDFTPLHSAAMEGHTEVVEYLLEKGADINPQTRGQKYTPTHSAAFGGHLETVRLLMKLGADLNLRNYRDETPIQTAERNEQLHVVGYMKMLNPNSN